MDDEIDEVVQALQGQGIELRIDGDRARLTIDGHALERAWRHGGTRDHRSMANEKPALVLGRRLSPFVMASVRARGDWYADGRGNAYVSAPGVRVDIRGQRPTEAPQRLGAHSQATNLLSARRSQVIFCLLTWPALLQASIRQVASVAGVSLAIAHSTRRALEEEGYLYHHAVTIDRREELLDRWVEAFPLGLSRDLTLGLFVGEPDPGAWSAKGQHVYVSGERAVSDLNGTSLTIYVPELDPNAIAASRWRRPRHDEQPTIVVRRRFWTDPELRDEPDGHARTAPLLLVYADLLSSRDARQREVAENLREVLRDPRSI